MSSNISETTSELGIDVLIDFSGIEEITNAIEGKVKLAAGKKLFTINPSQYQFKRIREILTELQKKIDTISKGREIEVIKEIVVEKREKMKPLVENLNEFISGSPKGSGMLTEYATKGLDILLGRVYKERETDFSKIELDDVKVKRVFEKLRTKGYEEAKISAAEAFSEKDSETMLNEIKKIYDVYVKEEKPLTQLSIVPLLEREQRKQRRVGINPFEERTTLKTIEDFRKSAIDKVGEFVDLFTSGAISFEDFETFINEKMSSIDEKLEQEKGRGRFTEGRERELIELAGQTKRILVAFKKFALVTEDEEKGKENIQKMYEMLSKGGEIPTELTKDIKGILKNLNVETMKETIALKLGQDVVGIIIEGMDKAIKDEHMKKFMQKELEKGISDITATALVHTIGSINNLIVTKLLDATNIEEAAELFREGYLPNLEKIQKIFDKINIEDMEKIETAAEYATMLSDLKTIKIEEITALFESMSILTDADVGAVFGIVDEVMEHEKSLTENLEKIRVLVSDAGSNAKEAVRQSDKIFTTINDMDAFLTAQNREAETLKTKIEKILPSDEKVVETLVEINNVSRKMEGLTGKFDDFSDSIKDVKKVFSELSRQINSHLKTIGAKADTLLVHIGEVGEGQ